MLAVLAIVKVGQGFRITIPEEARKLLELEEGDELLVYKTKGWIKRICLRKKHAPAKRKA